MPLSGLTVPSGKSKAKQNHPRPVDEYLHVGHATAAPGLPAAPTALRERAPLLPWRTCPIHTVTLEGMAFHSSFLVALLCLVHVAAKPTTTNMTANLPLPPLADTSAGSVQGWQDIMHPAGAPLTAVSWWNVSLAPYAVLSNAAVVSSYAPDGHVSTVPSALQPGTWLTFWGLSSSYRTTSSSPLPSNISLSPTTGVLGSSQQVVPTDRVAGGLWLFSVFRLPYGTWTGFYHEETHWTTTLNTAWDTIGVAWSYDEGASWTVIGTVLNATEAMPTTPTWGGDGNQGVIWEPVTQRYICYYGGISMAVSSDPLGTPGSWAKWEGAAFTGAGLGGADFRVANLSSVSGSNPSVHWNTFLQKWVMVYDANVGGLYISTSVDALAWEIPRLLTLSHNGGYARYPTITGPQGDLVSGSSSYLLYADFYKNDSTRSAAFRAIDFSGPVFSSSSIPSLTSTSDPPGTLSFTSDSAIPTFSSTDPVSRAEKTSGGQHGLKLLVGFLVLLAL